MSKVIALLARRHPDKVTHGSAKRRAVHQHESQDTGPSAFNELGMTRTTYTHHLHAPPSTSPP